MRPSKLAKEADRLGFTPQRMVAWLSPSELARSGIKTMLAAVFADYADKREIQAGLDATLLKVPAPESERDLWLDYTADTGDGFDATFTVASLLARTSVPVPGHDDLPRGDVLILGGDQVYPTASATAYENRTLGPFAAALPAAQPEPMMLLLPGNHDWYDGLTSFLRAFTHGRAIGGWRTHQTRSYFAVQLPYRWWLLGVDSQFGSYLDEPQLRYFEQALTDLRPGDGVIVCVASPSWVDTDGDPGAFDALSWFEEKYIRGRRMTPGSDECTPTGAEVRLWLTGDSHHYARYAERGAAEGSARQFVTCGLGGAFTSATHHLPPSIELLPAASKRRRGQASAHFDLGAERYPSVEQSRSLAGRMRNPAKVFSILGNAPGLLVVLGCLHLLLFAAVAGIFLLGPGSAPGPATGGSRSAIRLLLAADGAAVRGFALAWFLWTVGLAALAWIVNSSLRRTLGRSVGLYLAVLLQLWIPVVVLFLVTAGAARATDADSWPGEVLLVVVALIVTLLGAVLAILTLGLAIGWSRAPMARTWAMSGQGSTAYKGFLRLRLSRDGTLRIYPLGVDQVVEDWEIVDPPAQVPPPAGQAPPRTPWAGIRATDRLPDMHLIEDPVVIHRTRS